MAVHAFCNWLGFPAFNRMVRHGFLESALTEGGEDAVWLHTRAHGSDLLEREVQVYHELWT